MVSLIRVHGSGPTRIGPESDVRAIWTNRVSKMGKKFVRKGGKVPFPVQIQDFTLDNLRPALMGKAA